tara:strand:+ start:98 stop:550 length:453 start_codon:yes stop_codon:yes gene_type:complete
MIKNKQNFYLVRIGPNRKTPIKDYEKFKTNILKNNKGIWDSDKNNMINENDYFGFIIGETSNAKIEIYLVNKINNIDNRDSEWKTNQPYMIDNGKNSVSHRNQIELTNNHILPKIYDWFKFKSELGYAPNWSNYMPRGTMRVKNKHLLPF